MRPVLTHVVVYMFALVATRENFKTTGPIEMLLVVLTHAQGQRNIIG